ncbi:MAG TPA: Fic family protein [Pyrinomonadaceae bacterium]|jgi:cell filamentation protein|nr:Fic family protein [Pyrinomonadaceae bacterium]
MADRYNTTGNPEDQYYPGTSVLINLEDIRDLEELLERETELQLAAYEQIFSPFDESLTPDLPFFYYLHHMMFSPLFVWAGRSRTVGISKGGTPFCPPQNIDGMMNAIFTGLESERWLEGLDLATFIERAAYYICEINAVHPFREGNGRVIRFFVDVLSARTRGDIFDWTKSSADEYLQACVAGFQQDYGPMIGILKRCAS